MPTIEQVDDTCSYLLHNQNNHNWLNCVRDHIGPKHTSLDILNQWMRDHPIEAGQYEKGYGILSYFNNEGWSQVNFYIAYALNNPDSVHQCNHRDRALVYRNVGTVIGMARTLNAPPPGLVANFQLSGIVVVIDVAAKCIISAFPSPQPGTARIT